MYTHINIHTILFLKSICIIGLAQLYSVRYFVYFIHSLDIHICNSFVKIIEIPEESRQFNSFFFCLENKIPLLDI